MIRIKNGFIRLVFDAVFNIIIFFSLLFFESILLMWAAVDLVAETFRYPPRWRPQRNEPGWVEGEQRHVRAVEDEEDEFLVAIDAHVFFCECFCLFCLDAAGVTKALKIKLNKSGLLFLYNSYLLITQVALVFNHSCTNMNCFLSF